MQKEMYCRFCDKNHVVSETKDTNGNVVGYFCNSNKGMVVATTTKWNDEDVKIEIEKFAKVNVDRGVMGRINQASALKLANKMAFMFTQTPYAKERGLNYYFVQYHMSLVIKMMKGKAASEHVYKKGGSL